AMDDPLRMCDIQRAADLLYYIIHSLKLECSLSLNGVFESDSLDELHHHVEYAVVGLSGVEQRDHIRVFNQTGGVELGLKSLDEIFIPNERSMQYLYGAGAIVREIDRAIDIAHAAFAEFRFDEIFPLERQTQILIRTRFFAAYKKRAVERTMAQLV